MKTSIRNKKGFTIVELVIVIAVIAILAAVLIPTFANLVEKANQSADIQAVRQMNTHLAIDEIDSNKTIQDVYDALAEGGMSAENYTPLQSGTYFYWIKELNRIVYVGSDDKVIFPEEYEGKKLDEVAGTSTTYISLNGQVDVSGVEGDKIISKNKATISTGEQLYWLTQGENMKNVTEIEFTESEIDLHGASAVIVLNNDKKLTITGKNGGTTTIKGLVAVDSKYTDPNVQKEYAAGFVAMVDERSELTIKNIKLDGATVGGFEIGSVGALVGKIDGGSKVTIEGCQVTNSVINGKNKVGALVGAIGLWGEDADKKAKGSEVSISNCKIENCTVNCSEGESGKAIGCVYNSTGKLTINQAFNTWVDDETTLNLVSTDREVKTGTVTYKKDNSAVEVKDCQKIVRVLDNNGKPENTKDTDWKAGLPKYRMFADDACMTVFNNTDVNVTINGSKLNGISDLTKCEQKIDSTEIGINILTFVK